MSGSDSTYAAISGNGASVLERVLLAIINAHTSQETEGQQGERLEAAMKALIGPVTQHECGIERALLYMARQRQRDACNREMNLLRHGSGCAARICSNRELAELAAREVLGCTISRDIRDAASRLCEMFAERRTHPVEPDYVQGALETEAVKRLCDELAEWDVPTRL